MSNTSPISEFPHHGTLQEQLKFLLQYAVLAPSTHNTQPWLWRIEGDEITLRADRSRALRALDPQFRELVMSCGAALHHLRLAMRVAGHGAVVQPFPDEYDADLLCRVRFGSPREPTENDELLFRFITERHTHRGEFEARELPSNLLLALQEEAEHYGATLHLAREAEQRGQIISLIELGDIVQQSDPEARRDMARWMTPPGAGDDGIPTRALGISDMLAHLAPLGQRLWNGGEAVADHDRDLAMNAPVLAVLAAPADTPSAWLDAGQALSAVLLHARAKNVWASFFSQPVQVDDAWSQLRHILGISDYPQLVFRLGYAAPVAATPRRSVEDVLESSR